MTGNILALCQLFVLLEGLYSRKSKSGYHVITELFHLKLWIAAAKQSYDVP